MEYFLLCSYLLAQGSIIEPGNWGRTLRLYSGDKNMNMSNPYKEQIYEKVRQDNFPDKPSRLECLFLCETIEESKLFKERNNRIFDLIYKVRLNDESKATFRADWEKVKFVDIDSIESIAHEYWSGVNISRPEILTLSSVEIIDLINS